MYDGWMLKTSYYCLVQFVMKVKRGLRVAVVVVVKKKNTRKIHYWLCNSFLMYYSIRSCSLLRIKAEEELHLNMPPRVTITQMRSQSALIPHTIPA